MRLVATLLLRDEADVVEANLLHHYAQGVDFIIATDLGSADGSVEILERYASQGRLELRHEPGERFEQARWVTSMARSAATDHGADWVLNMDCDEFWVPKDRTRTLAETFASLPDDVGRTSSRCQNLEGFPGPMTDTPDPDWWLRLVWRRPNTLSERGTPLAARVCHRADPDVEIPNGHHDAIGPRVGAFAESDPFDLLHVPMRSWAQFRNKIDVGARALMANTSLGPEAGWHWRADYERLQRGELEDAYRARCLSVKRLVGGVARRQLVLDTWLRNHLAVLLSSS